MRDLGLAILRGHISLLAAIVTSTVSAYVAQLATVPSAPGGSWHFPALAAWVAGSDDQILSQPISTRDMGYPLLLALVGNSGEAILIAQGVMAAAIPIAVYISVAFFSHFFAWAAMVGTICSLSSYQFAGWLHHDQLFIFLAAISASLTIAFVLRGSSWLLAMLTLSWVLTSVSRPAAAFCSFTVLTVLLVLSPSRRKIVAVALLLSILASLCYGFWRSNQISRLNGNDYSAIQLFFLAYVVAGEGGLRIQREDGPASQELLTAISERASNLLASDQAASAWRTSMGFSEDRMTYLLPSSVRGNEEILTKFIIDHPTQDNFEFIQFLTDYDYPLLSGVALEAMRAQPTPVAKRALRNTYDFLWDPGFAYGRFIDPLGPPRGRQQLDFYMSGANTAQDQFGLMPTSISNAFAVREPRLPLDRVQVLSVPHTSISINIRSAYASVYQTLTRISLLFVFLGLLATVLRRDRVGLAAIACVCLPYLLMAGLTAIAVGPDFRYHLMTMPIALMAGGIGASLLFRPAFEMRNGTQSCVAYT